ALLDPAGHLGIPLDHHDVVRLVGEPLGDVVAHLAGSDHDDAHAGSVLRLGFLILVAGGGVGRLDLPAGPGAEELGAETPAGSPVGRRFFEISRRLRVVDAVEAEGPGRLSLRHRPSFHARGRGRRRPGTRPASGSRTCRVPGADASVEYW